MRPTIDSFPKQGRWLNRRVCVCFDYDGSRTLLGTLVRDDVEEPYRTVIRLDDGRIVLGPECQYRPAEEQP